MQNYTQTPYVNAMPKVEVAEGLWTSLLNRLRSGEITRPEAAEIAQIKLATLNTKLRRGGHLESLKDVRRSAGQYHAHSEKDPVKIKAMADAVAEALANPNKGVKAVWEANYKGHVSYVYLCRKVKAAQVRAAA